MERIASANDLDKLRDSDRGRIIELLAYLEEHRLSCRCVMVGGKDFTVLVGPGYATARFWREAFGLT